MSVSVESVSADDSGKHDRCIVCREQIQKGARICTHCKSWQDWTRVPARWSAVITAILAIAPLWAGAASLYNLAFRSQADVKMRPIQCSESAIQLAVTNVGRNAGLLGQSAVAVKVAGRKEETPIALQSSTERVVVKAQETFILDLRPHYKGTPLLLPKQPKEQTCEYVITTPVSEFDGPERQAVTTCDCPSSVQQ